MNGGFQYAQKIVHQWEVQSDVWFAEDILVLQGPRSVRSFRRFPIKKRSPLILVFTMYIRSDIQDNKAVDIAGEYPCL